MDSPAEQIVISSLNAHLMKMDDYLGILTITNRKKEDC